MKNFKRQISILMLMLSAYVSGAQCDKILNIKVLDYHDSMPLTYATIHISELNLSAYSNDSGKCRFDSLCPGLYHILISHAGCPTINKYIDFYTNNQEVIIMMEHHDEMLETVEIVSNEADALMGKFKSTVSRDYLLDYSINGLSSATSLVPGVNTMKVGNNVAKPIINGLTGHRIAYVHNGIMVESQQWGIDHAPEIDPTTVDQVSVIKGPATIKYGTQAIGGVVLTEINRTTDPHWHGNLNFSFQSNGRVAASHVNIHKAFKHWSLNTFGTLQLAGDRSAPNYYLTNTGSRMSNFTLALGQINNSKSSLDFTYSFNKSRLGILRGSHIGNLTDLIEAYGREIPFYTDSTFSYDIQAPYQDVVHHILSAKYLYRLSDKWSASFHSALQINKRLEYDVRRSNSLNRPSLALDLFNTWTQFNSKYNHDRLSSEFGVQFKYNYNVNNPATGISPLIPDYALNNLGLFNTTKYKISNLFTAELGFRFDRRVLNSARIVSNEIVRSENINNTYAIYAGFRTQIDHLTFYTDLSYTQRPPDVSELYSSGLHQGVSGIEQGNPLAPNEKLWRVGQEATIAFGHHVHCQANVYFNRFDDFIYLEPSGENRLTIRGAFPVFSYQSIKADIYGASGKVLIDFDEHWQFTVLTDYTKGQDRTNNYGLVRIPPLTNKFNLQFSNVFLKSFLKEINIGTEVVVVSRQKNVRDEDDFLLPPSGYSIQNLWFKARLVDKNQSEKLKIIFRIENIWNSSYRDYLNRWRYFADELGRNFTLIISKSF